MTIIISGKILEKITSREISEREIKQCFENISGTYLEDPREEHRTDPPTHWFVSETNCGRKLKIMFVHRDSNIFIKSAFEATEEIIRIYEKYGY